MKLAKDLLICLVLALVGMLLAECVRSLHLLTATAVELPARTDAAIAREGNATRAAAVAEIEATRKDLAAQVAELNALVAKRSDTITAQLATVSTSLAGNLDKLGNVATAAQLDIHSVREQVSPALTNLNDAAVEIKPVLRDARMVEAQTALAMAHVKGMANSIDEQTPKIAGSVAGITADVHTLTTDLTKPKPWYRTVLSYLGDGLKIGGTIF